MSPSDDRTGCWPALAKDFVIFPQKPLPVDDSLPTAGEFQKMSKRVEAYIAARESKNFPASDALRTELEAAGWMPVSGYKSWHPNFESSAHRSARLKARSL